MNHTGEDPTSETDPSRGTLPEQIVTPASFARHDVDVEAPDDARGGHEQASFDRHDTDVNKPDTVDEVEQATFDRHDVDVDDADAVSEGEANFDRHDGPD